MGSFGKDNFEHTGEHFSHYQQRRRQMGENAEQPWSESRMQGGGYSSYRNLRPDYRSFRPDYRYYPNDFTPPHFFAGNHNDYPANDPGWRHHDDNYWTERNDYKDSDYRYRSGHRGYWHDDYDEIYANKPRRFEHPESFFTHMAEGFRQGWHNLTHREKESDEDERMRQMRKRRPDQNYPDRGDVPYDRENERW